MGTTLSNGGKNRSEGPAPDPAGAVATVAARPRPPRTEGQLETIDVIPPGADDDSFASAIQPGMQVGRYVIEHQIGRGGVGLVFSALDPELDRKVAIKLLRAASAESIGSRPSSASVESQGRLLREAQAMAKLTHPNVLPVFDVGVAVDRVFMAMELIDGGTLRDWERARPHPWREVVTMLLQAGRGLAAAHAAGLIHRDFKPDNVLIGSDGRVRVTDFGLVRALNAPERRAGDAPGVTNSSPKLLETPMTEAACVMGTPGYMAPEQFAAATTDERTNQFAFCATLYEALYDVRPFVGQTFEEVRDATVAGRVRPPPSGVRVPAWLHRVVLRGLSVGAEQRWPSMEALLAALVVDPGARRRRLAVAGIGLAALAIAGGMVYRANLRAARENQLAQRFVREVEQFDALMQQSSLLPLHDTRSERRNVESRLLDIERELPALVGAARGPARYALGRGYLALGEVERAHAQLDAAWREGHRSSEVEYALGRALGELYRIHRAELLGLDGDVRKRKEQELATHYREPALQHLRAGVAQQTESPEYAEALIAFYDQRWDDALARATLAQAKRPWLFEALRLKGHVHLAMAEELTAGGKPDEAVKRYQEAGRAYRSAIEIAHSDVPALEAECARLAGIAVVNYDLSRLDEGLPAQVNEACDRAALAYPGRNDGVLQKARALSLIARVVGGRGGDAEPLYAAAITAAETAVAAHVDDYEAQMMLGLARGVRGQYRLRKGGDPTADTEIAIVAYRAAARLRPQLQRADSQLAQFLADRGAYKASQGQDASANLAEAVQHAERVVTLARDVWDSYLILGYALEPLAELQADSGLDARTTFDRTIAANTEVARRAPQVDYGFVNNCGAQIALARHLGDRGEDPMQVLAAAAANCEHALAVAPTEIEAELSLAQACALAAERESASGRDPAAWLHKGRAAVSAALALDAKSDTAYLRLAELEMAAARTEPAALAAATRAWERARGLNPKSAATHETGARLFRLRAEGALARHRPVAQLVAAGLAEVATTLAEQPHSPRALLIEGTLHLVTARDQPEERATAALRAAGSFERARRMNANLDREIAPLLADARAISAPTDGRRPSP